MKISEMIEKLEQAKSELGDVTVGVVDFYKSYSDDGFTFTDAELIIGVGSGDSGVNYVILTDAEVIDHLIEDSLIKESRSAISGSNG